MKKNKIEIKYDKKLDNDKKLQEQANYYDNVDITKEFDMKKAKLVKSNIKRVNILIPNDIFLEAEKIGKITGIGYQNTLKTAMAIGLHQLAKQL
jgi:hypothetical protein